MKKVWLILVVIVICSFDATSQVENAADRKILLNGIIRDASTLVPLENTQIKINGSFVSVSDEEGTFIVRVNKRAYFFVSDTLSSSEFLTGVYMRTDTLSIGEVVITPRLSYLRSDILKTPPTTVEMENAKYNLAVSAYQGKVAISRLGDPASNYSVLHQKQRLDAFEKGTIPSDRMVALSPLILIPAAYLLMNGLPEREPPLKSNLTKQELDQIHKKYLETMTKR
jgi:hypothetical protein